MSLSHETARDRSEAETSPMANLQRTLSGLGPRLDAARYKAEAGLSRRGYVSSPGLRCEEGVQRLMNAPEPGSTSTSEGCVGVDGDSLTDSENEVSHGRSIERDDLKWPVGEGEGWKPL